MFNLVGFEKESICIIKDANYIKITLRGWCKKIKERIRNCKTNQFRMYNGNDNQETDNYIFSTNAIKIN